MKERECCKNIGRRDTCSIESLQRKCEKICRNKTIMARLNFCGCQGLIGMMLKINLGNEIDLRFS